MSRKTRELKADIENAEPPFSDHEKQELHRTLFHLDSHTDDLYITLDRLEAR